MQLKGHEFFLSCFHYRIQGPHVSPEGPPRGPFVSTATQHRRGPDSYGFGHSTPTTTEDWSSEDSLPFFFSFSPGLSMRNQNNQLQLHSALNMVKDSWSLQHPQHHHLHQALREFCEVSKSQMVGEREFWSLWGFQRHHLCQALRKLCKDFNMDLRGRYHSIQAQREFCKDNCRGSSYGGSNTGARLQCNCNPIIIIVHCLNYLGVISSVTKFKLLAPVQTVY